MKRRFTQQSATRVAREAGVEPVEPYPNNMTKDWECKCKTCGKTVFPRMVNMANGKRGCHHCRGAKPVVAADAEEVMINAGVQPLEPYPGYTVPWKVKCVLCGRISRPQYANIRKGQGGCFRCGTDYGDTPAMVYLFHNQKLKALKIGITNISAHRLSIYKSWSLVRLIEAPTGKQAAMLEADVLKSWRDMGLPEKLTREQMPGKGHTETADEAGLADALQIFDKYELEWNGGA